MKVSLFKKLNQALFACCFFFTVGATAFAQVQPQTNDTVDVNSAPSTWIQPATGNAVTIGQGVTGVAVNNDTGGVISSSDAVGIFNAGEATIDNSGTISGAVDAIDFVNGQGAGAVTNRAAGSITSDSRAIDVGAATLINNQGNITGTGDQRNGTIYSDSTSDNFTLNNSGTIDAGAGNSGAGFSAELSAGGNNFTIDNGGSIQGRGTAGAGLATAGDGIRLERTRVSGALDGSTTGLFSGVINNSGDITSEGNSGTTAGFRAVNGVSFQGTLDNSGTISGVQNGVYFGNPTPAGGGDHQGGVVNNSGTISSGSRALNIDGNGLEVNNTGNILATGAQRNGTFYVDGTADNFTLNNSGSIDARGGSGSAVSIQVGSFDGDIQSGAIVNSGSFIGQGNSGFDAGLRLFTNATTATFQGDILNDVGGLITSSGSAALLIEDDVVFDGTFINSGEIEGSIQLGSGDLRLTDTSLLSLDVTSLTDFESVSVAGDIFFDGILELNFADPFDFQVGQTIDLFDFGLAQGGFDSISSQSLTFDTSNFLSNGSLTIASVSAVPEPSSAIVLGLGGLGLLRRRRRQT